MGIIGASIVNHPTMVPAPANITDLNAAFNNDQDNVECFPGM